MAQKQIRFTGVGDFSQLIRSSKEVTGILQNTLGKSGLQLFDKNSTQFLTQYSKHIFSQMRMEMEKLVEEARELDAVLKDSTTTEQRQNAAVEARLVNLKKMSNLQREMQVTESKSLSPTGGRGVGKAIAGGAADIGRAAGLGAPISIASAGAEAASAGGLAGLGMGALTVALAAATFAVTRMVGAFETFEHQVPAMLTGAAIGIGAEPSARERAGAQQMGFSVEDTMAQRTELARSFGTARPTREQENILTNTQTAGRALGINPGEIAGAGNQLRAVMGPQESLKTVSQILSRAMAEGMDKSQATHFLAVSASLLGELNKSGLQSTNALAAAMGALTKGNAMSPEMAARGIRGIQSAITGASGESAQFFRFAAARGGIGKGTLLGSVAAQEQGLTGINPESFLKTTGNNKAALGMLNQAGLVDNGKYTQNFAKGILGQLDATGFNQKTPEGMMGRAKFVQERFGLGTIQESFQVENILKKLSQGEKLSKDEKTKMQELGKDPEAAWRDKALSALNNIAGTIAKVESRQSFTKFDLGKESSDVMIALKEALLELDQTILETFSFLKQGKDVANTVMDTVVGGVSSLFSPDVELAKGAGPDKKPETTMEKFLVTMISMLGATADQGKKTNELLDAGNKDRKKSLEKPGSQPPMVNRKK